MVGECLLGKSIRNGCLNLPCLILPVVSGLLLVLSFPSFGWWGLAWFGLVPLLRVLPDCSGFKAFGMGLLCGVVFFAGTLRWLLLPSLVETADFWVFVLYLSLYVGLFSLGTALIYRRLPGMALVMIPALWVSIEYLRSHVGFLSLPWALLGYSQADFTPLIQLAALTGVYGVSYLLIFMNVALAEWAIRPRERRARFIFALAVVTGVTGWGYVRLQYPIDTASTVGIAVVPGHIPQDQRWDSGVGHAVYRRYVDGTLRAAHEGKKLDLVVWPETAILPSLVQSGGDLPTLKDLARAYQTSVVFGSAERAKFQGSPRKSQNRFNSVFLMTAEGQVAGRYHKIRLFPFGEYLPHSGWLPWPSRAKSRASNFLSGEERTVFSLSRPDGGMATFSALVCWEIAFPDLVREFIGNGAHMLLNLTNEAWFPGRGFPRQFLDIARFRAVEHGVSVIRAANYGLSGFIDPRGRVVEVKGPQEAEPSGPDFVLQNVPAHRMPTPYSTYGDGFVFANVLLVLVGGLFSCLFRPRSILRGDCSLAGADGKNPVEVKSLFRRLDTESLTRRWSMKNG